MPWVTKQGPHALHFCTWEDNGNELRESGRGGGGKQADRSLFSEMIMPCTPGQEPQAGFELANAGFL